MSLADAQAVRERLAGDGHAEVGAERAQMRVVNTCCVTAEAVAKSRKAVRRAARTAERVLVTGCAANLRGAAFDGVAANVTVVPGPLRARARRGRPAGSARSAVPAPPRRPSRARAHT